LKTKWSRPACRNWCVTSW